MQRKLSKLQVSIKIILFTVNEDNELYGYAIGYTYYVAAKAKGNENTICGA